MTEAKHIAEVDGKHLKDWWDNAPAGAFTHAVRRTIDPYYGMGEGAPQKWLIKARITEVYDDTVIVDAASEKEARDKGYGMWQGFNDVEIVSATATKENRK